MMMQLFNTPSYVKTDMDKMLPKEIVNKVGTRVMAGNLCELLRQHISATEEILDLEAIATEAEQA